MNKPTFFLIGAGKAGTTSLAYYLAQHPKLMISDPKEPTFFQIEYDRGLEHYWRTCFAKYAGEIHAGDAAHLNSRLPYVAKRIRESCPEARVLMICRNPTERAFSAYWHNFVRKVEARSFAEAIDENFRRLEQGPLFETEEEETVYRNGLEAQRKDGQVRYASYIDSGYYARHLERFAKLFGGDRIKTVFFEDLEESPQQVSEDVWNFLDLEPVEVVDEDAQNTTASPIVGTLTRLAFRVPGISKISPEFRARIRNQLAELLPGKKPNMPADVRYRLVEHFKPENQALEKMTGRSLAHWNT